MAAGETYEQFVEKFKPKRTTDDCLTPDNIYSAVVGWTVKEYGISQNDIVRPFWPGKDYQEADYPSGAVVLDNPPFSILAQIIRFYTDHDIKYFLFAPALTLFSTTPGCKIGVGASITYQNGAQISTSFVTNLQADGVRTAPELYRAVEAAEKVNLIGKHKQIPKYIYPDNVLTASMLSRYSKYGIDFSVDSTAYMRIRSLDSQRVVGKAIYGSGMLLSNRAAAERAAAERAAAERAAAERWVLSDRERGIIAAMP